MPADLSEMNKALSAAYSASLRAYMTELSWPLWGDRTVTRIRIAPNLFPRARRIYGGFWSGVRRVEDAVNVLVNGLPETDY